ncbi:MAG: Trp family transcriptional regulator [Patescibacteria group bacterium]
MQVSKKKVNPVLEKQLFAMLWQLVTDLKNPKEAEMVWSDLLSKTELATVAKRLAVAYWLSKKRSYENIKQNLKVSSATVAGVQRSLKRPGWKLAMVKVTADEWANVWETKIKKILRH